MAIAYRDEITAAIALAYPGVLNTDADEATDMKNCLNNFKNNDKLTGEMWNKTYQKIDAFNDILQVRNTTASSVGDAINSSLSKVLTSLKEYDMLDTAKIPEVEGLIKELNEKLAALAGQDDEETQALRAYLQEQIRIASKFLDDLKNFEAVYNAAMATLTEAASKVSEFNSKVSAITPSPKYAYVKES